MNKPEFIDFVKSIQQEINWTIDQVSKRGFDDCSEEYDDYTYLIQQKEFRNLIVVELYENYFPPRRHEFELQILNDLIDAVIKYQPWSYIIGSAASGVIGNTIYDLLKVLLFNIIRRFRKTDNKRVEIYKEIKNNISKIEKYFITHEFESQDILEKCLNIDKERLLPLLKLLGFKYYRKPNNLWVRPYCIKDNIKKTKKS